MNSNTTNTKGTKKVINNGFLIGQVLLSVLIITSILIFGNMTYRNNINQAKEYRLQVEIENMKEIVSNLVVRFDVDRSDAISRVNGIISICTSDADQYTDGPELYSKKIITQISNNETGNIIHVIVENNRGFTLFNTLNKTGVSIAPRDAESILSKEAVGKKLQMSGCTIHVFALQADIDKQVQEREYAYIHSLKFTQDTYIWVNEILNMDGGDNYAIRRIHPNLVETEGEYLSTSMQDIKGNYPYEVELSGIRENGEVVQQYFFKNKSDEKIGEKISYAVYYEPFHWVIAMGTPLDSLYADIQNLSSNSIGNFSAQLTIVCILIFSLLFISVKRSMDRLSSTAEIAENASKAKSIFLSNMSHDIRTPMNAIIGYTRIALKKNPDPEIKNCLEKINESSDHLLSLINDVLDISRIESGKTSYNPVPVDITTITDMVLDISQGFLNGRDIQLNVERDTFENPYVLADAVRIREILVNIMSNSIKFTNDGGRISFKTECCKGFDSQHIVVRYIISDNGIGMSEEFQQHMFDEFAQEGSNARTQYVGTGLGMAITKKYVDMMDGTITVQSKKNVGTTTVVELPLELTFKEKVPEKKNQTDKADLYGTRVLLAEDNDLNAEIATVQLKEFGMNVTRATDGQNAFELFLDNPENTFDIILMDIMMPNMNGYDATTAIRNCDGRQDGKTIPIIAMTANAFAEDVQQSINAGMNDHLAKPIQPDKLIEIIKKNLS